MGEANHSMTTAVRKLDAHERKSLINYFFNCAQRLYSWGAFDCATFCADWVKIQTGVDLMEIDRGTYASRTFALTKLGRDGFLPWLRRLEEIERPTDGAIVLIEKPGQPETLAIWKDGKAWHPLPKGIGPYEGTVKRSFFPCLTQY